MTTPTHTIAISHANLGVFVFSYALITGIVDGVITLSSTDAELMEAVHECIKAMTEDPELVNDYSSFVNQVVSIFMYAIQNKQAS